MLKQQYSLIKTKQVSSQTADPNTVAETKAVVGNFITKITDTATNTEITQKSSITEEVTKAVANNIAPNTAANSGATESVATNKASPEAYIKGTFKLTSKDLKKFMEYAKLHKNGESSFVDLFDEVKKLVAEPNKSVQLNFGY